MLIRKHLSRFAILVSAGLHGYWQTSNPLHLWKASQSIQSHTLITQLGGGALPNPSRPMDTSGHVCRHTDICLQSQSQNGTTILQPSLIGCGPCRHLFEQEIELSLLHGIKEECVQARGIFQGYIATIVQGELYIARGDYCG